jgi:hypothetical protein
MTIPIPSREKGFVVDATTAVSGKAASKDQLTRVLYLVSRFNPVLEIGDVECYHIG